MNVLASLTTCNRAAMIHQNTPTPTQTGKFKNVLPSVLPQGLLGCYDSTSCLILVCVCACIHTCVWACEYVVFGSLTHPSCVQRVILLTLVLITVYVCVCMFVLRACVSLYSVSLFVRLSVCKEVWRSTLCVCVCVHVG